MTGFSAYHVDAESFVDALVETSHDLVCVLDRNGVIVRFNHVCEEATGWSADEVVGRDARDFVIPPDEAPSFGEFLAEVWRTGLPSPQIGHWLRRDGSRLPVAWANRPLFDENGEPLHVITAGNDLTERERTAAELRSLAVAQASLRRVATSVAQRESPERLFAIVSAEIAALLAARTAGVFRFEGEEAVVVGRHSTEDFVGFPVGTRVPMSVDSTVARVFHTGRPARIESYSVVSGPVAEQMRETGFDSAAAAPVRIGGQMWGAIIVVSVRSLPVATEDRLDEYADLLGLALASADARERVLESRRRLVQASDAERKRLERNLHDGAQQRLVSLGIALRLARARVDTDPAGAASLLDSAAVDLDAAVQELRELAQGLHPAILSDHGLKPAVTQLARRSPVPVTVEVEAEGFPDEVKAALYYLTAEALTNAAKHAGASSARVSVWRVGDLAVCEISDDGRGGAGIREGTGLRGLRDRVEALRGVLLIESEPGRGTRLRAELPLLPA
jgi:PAS domain S-box-containing protein